MLITCVLNDLIININFSYHHCNVDNFAEKDKSLKFHCIWCDISKFFTVCFCKKIGGNLHCRKDAPEAIFRSFFLFGDWLVAIRDFSKPAIFLFSHGYRNPRMWLLFPRTTVRRVYSLCLFL